MIFHPQARARAMTPVTPDCIAQAARRMAIPVLAIVGILSVERGQVGRATPDPDGTYDYGPMQINTVWLPHLAARFHLSVRAVRDRGCTNIMAGTWILREEWRSLGADGSIWMAIADYHSHTPALAFPYAWQVYDRLRRGVRLASLLRFINAQ